VSVKENKMHAFQGDINFIKVSKIPDGAKTVKKTERGYVLAEGEATGHAHTIKDDVELYEVNGVLYMRNSKSVDVRHEEHHTVTVEPGEWKIGITREYDYLKDEERKVAD
jgi:hypothetical protein